MNELIWNRTRLLFEETQIRLISMEPADPMPRAAWCHESAHRTLGHLTACQASWIHLMRRIRDGHDRGDLPINPDPLYAKLSFKSLSWQIILNQFLVERAEWRDLLDKVDLTREIHTSKRAYTPQTLTKRMVEHEKRHLEDLAST